jgi:uncharacterized membrane protein YphA (DoxX/SURF4 family)
MTITPFLHRLALILLCSAYVQGPVTKLLDFAGAQAEMAHFGLEPPLLFAVGVVIFELAASAAVIFGFFRGPAALALGAFTIAASFIALPFWSMPAGQDRMMAMNAFFEHLGLAGAFLLVALATRRAAP